jgi:hypothetical protein
LCGQPCDPDQTTFRLAVPLGHEGSRVVCNDCTADAVPLAEVFSGDAELSPDLRAQALDLAARYPEWARPPLRSGQLVTWTDRAWQRPA